jgi:hypothetical protein
MAGSIFVLQFALVALKVVFVLLALLLFIVAAGWLMGADNIALPGLGLIFATPVLMMLIAIAGIVILIASMIVSALSK